MVKKVFVVNIKQDEIQTEVFKDDIRQATNGLYNLEFVDSTSWWVSVVGGNVTVQSKQGRVDLSKSCLFVRSRVDDSPFVGLLSHLCKLQGVLCTDAANQYHSSFTDKSYAIPRLAQYGLPVPDSIIISNTAFQKNFSAVIEQLTFPCVVKTSGSRGDNVQLMQNEEELMRFQLELIAVKDPASLLTIQEFIENSYDVRALYFGQKCLGVMRRTRLRDADFVNNASKGAKVESDILSDAESVLCKQAQAVSYLDLCGVDFIRTPAGIKFLEINKSPQVDAIRGVVPEISVGAGLVRFIQDNSANSKS